MTKKWKGTLTVSWVNQSLKGNFIHRQIAVHILNVWLVFLRKAVASRGLLRHNINTKSKTTCWGRGRRHAFKNDAKSSRIYSPLGCQNCEMNLIFGGLCGYSLGKYKCALNKPPSLRKTETKFYGQIIIETHAITVCYHWLREENLLEGLWGSNYHELPFVKIFIVY